MNDTEILDKVIWAFNSYGKKGLDDDQVDRLKKYVEDQREAEIKVIDEKPIQAAVNRAMKRNLAKREWDAEATIREVVRDELHTATLVSGENAKLIFELVVPSEIKAEILAGEAQLHIHDRDDKLIYVVTTFDIRGGE